MLPKVMLMNLAPDKKLHLKVMAIAIMVLALFLELATIAGPLILLAVFHWKRPKWAAWEKIALVASIGIMVSLAKEAWDDGAFNGWLPVILQKNPLTGFDLLDLGFSLLGVTVGDAGLYYLPGLEGQE
jgi:hypothetical protein